MMRTSPFETSDQQPLYLPGDLSPKAELARMIRVNQAGEYGAKRIYRGQLDMLSGTEKKEIIEHMAEQEQVHLDYFDAAIAHHHSRPSFLSPAWHVAGYALGALPSLLGSSSAMAVTVAVEETIDAHYDAQAERLEERGDYSEILQKIRVFQAEEEEHRDIGLEHEARTAPAYPLLYGVVSNFSKGAIYIAERI